MAIFDDENNNQGSSSPLQGLLLQEHLRWIVQKKETSMLVQAYQ